MSSTSGLILECSFRLQFWSYANVIYTCSAKIVNNENPEMIEAIRGNHIADKCHIDVQGLVISEQVLKQIPMNVAAFFPNLTGVNFYDTELASLDSSDLEQFPKMIFLRVMKNKLVTLDRDLFKFNPILQYIDFDTNFLERVGTDILGNLESLQEADFRNNPCINKYADDPESIIVLNYQLPIKCPPLNEASTSTELPICHLRCSLEEEVDGLKNKMTLEAEVNEKQSELIKMLEYENSEQSKRIEELEKKIDKIINSTQ